MKPQSAKAKGRKLQKWFTELLIERLKLDKDDLESRPMGSQGEDIIMGKNREQNSLTASSVKMLRDLMFGMLILKQKRTVKPMSHWW